MQLKLIEQTFEMVQPQLPFTFADLYAGIGGFRTGLERIGGRCVFSAEIDSNAERTYEHNFGSKFDAHDVSKINPRSVPTVDVLCAGFPCQPFSIAGKRRGFEDDRSEAFSQLLKIAKVSKPSVLFFENVKNLLSHDSGKTFSAMRAELIEAGYSVSYATLNSSDFGVPQNRPRLFIVAFLSKSFSIDKFRFRIPGLSRVPVRDILVPGDDSIPITSHWEELIDYYTGRKSVGDLSFRPAKTRVSLERIDPGADLDDCIFQMRSSGIRALSLDKPLPTLAVSISGGGAMIPVYSSERRHLSLREMTRIMGFPDTYGFPVARTHAIKQLANAVCPPVIQSVGLDILRVLHG